MDMALDRRPIIFLSKLSLVPVHGLKGEVNMKATRGLGNYLGWPYAFMGATHDDDARATRRLRVGGAMLLFGSVADQVLREAGIPVLWVRPSQGAG